MATKKTTKKELQQQARAWRNTSILMMVIMLLIAGVSLLKAGTPDAETAENQAEAPAYAAGVLYCPADFDGRVAVNLNSQDVCYLSAGQTFDLNGYLEPSVDSNGTHWVCTDVAVRSLVDGELVDVGQGTQPVLIIGDNVEVFDDSDTQRVYIVTFWWSE